MFFQVLRTYIDAKFHGESISDGFRAIRQRKVGEKLKKPRKNRQTRFSGQPSPKSLSINPASHCRYTVHGRARSDGLRPGSVECKQLPATAGARCHNVRKRQIEQNLPRGAVPGRIWRNTVFHYFRKKRKFDDRKRVPEPASTTR